MDAGSGAIVSAANADEPRYPASLTKMMTLYMLFEALRDRRVTLDQMVPVSAWAASMSPTKLGLTPGSAITVEQAILGLVTKSATTPPPPLVRCWAGRGTVRPDDDAARPRPGHDPDDLPQCLGPAGPGSVDDGAGPGGAGAPAVQDFPVQYRYFSTPAFVFRGRTILNHQHMLETYPGADGLKTGWIRDSGHNLVTSALHGNVRMIGVVLGRRQHDRTRPAHGDAAGRRLRSGRGAAGLPGPGAAVDGVPDAVHHHRGAGGAGCRAGPVLLRAV